MQLECKDGVVLTYFGDREIPVARQGAILIPYLQPLSTLQRFGSLPEGWPDGAPDPRQYAAPDITPEILASIKAQLSADVDAQAETVRLRYITPGAGQAMVYLQKQTQAAIALNAQAATAAATADANAALYPLLAAEIGLTIDPTTNAPATDVLGVARQVNATVQLWMPIAAAIEKVRMAGKAAVLAATTAAAAQAAHDAVTWPSA